MGEPVDQDEARKIARDEIASLLGATLEDAESPALRAWASKLLPQFGSDVELRPGPES